MGTEATIDGVETERVDDVPLLIGSEQRMGIGEVIDAVIEPHGNWSGASIGELVLIWLAYILSEADHRMCQVELWAKTRLAMLRAAVDEELDVKDFTDDRLAAVLRYLADNENWRAVEQQLGERLVRVYELDDELVRLDSTTASVHHDRQQEERTLFEFGHSKDHRPDLLQMKIMLGSLDPLGLPLATLVVPGNEADDPLYVPTIDHCRRVLGERGRLYVGDSKMAASATRAHVHAGGDYYLTALPRTGNTPELLEELLAPVFNEEQTLIEIRDDPDEDALAEGYELTRLQTTEIDGEEITWEERVLVVRSLRNAKRLERSLETRLTNAEQALQALTPPRKQGRRQYEELEPLEEAVAEVLKRHRVSGLLNVRYTLEVERRDVRKDGDNPARTEVRQRYLISVERDAEAIEATRKRLGWRLQVTNAPAEQLSFERAVRSYRASYTIEQNFRRLKNRPLGIGPLYVQREDHVTGLTRLLTVGLRVATLLEHDVRRKLQTMGEALAGLYAGIPSARPIDRPRSGCWTPSTGSRSRSFGWATRSCVM